MAAVLIATDRRRMPRLAAERFGVAPLAVVRPGVSVCVLQISGGGALVESSAPIRPGARTELALESASGHRWQVGVEVLRCWVAALDPLRFRSAVQFDEVVSPG